MNDGVHQQAAHPRPRMRRWLTAADNPASHWTSSTPLQRRHCNHHRNDARPFIHLIYSQKYLRHENKHEQVPGSTAEPRHAPYCRVLLSSNFSTTIAEPLAYYSESCIIFVMIPVTVIAMQARCHAVSVCLSVRHVREFCQNEWRVSCIMFE